MAESDHSGFPGPELTRRLLVVASVKLLEPWLANIPDEMKTGICL